MRLSEPTTSITDFLLAGELFFFSFLTFRADTDQWSVILWAIALATLGLSAVAGGLYHGVSPSSPIWRMTAICIVATLGFMIAAGIVSTCSGLLRTALLALTEIPLLILVVRLSKQRSPGVTVRHSNKRILILLFALALILLYQLYTGGPLVGVWLLAGSLIIFTGLWIQQAEWSLHKQFNHNDLCHVFFMVGVYFLYRGGLLLRDR